MQYLQEIQQYVLSQDSILAAWLGGSSATKRQDSLSDIDLCLIAKDTGKEFQNFENFLREIAEIEHILVEARRGAYDQRFYVLKDTAPTYYLDLCIFDSEDPKTYAEYFNPKRHGEPQIFKTHAILTRAKSAMTEEEFEIDPCNMMAKFVIYYRTFMKEVARDRYIDAFYFYQGLVSIYMRTMRMIHSPQRHDFTMRYLYSDLPQNESALIEECLKMNSFEGMSQMARTLKQNLQKVLNTSDLQRKRPS